MHYRELEFTFDIVEHSRRLREVARSVIAESHRLRQEARSLIKRNRAEDRQRDRARERTSAAEQSSTVTAGVGPLSLRSAPPTP